MDGVQTILIKDGVRLHYIKSDKFKTNTLTVYFCRPLCKEEVTANALIAQVLKRACKEYPTTGKLEQRLEELYGTELESGVQKKGDIQTLYFRFDFASEKFIPNGKGGKTIFDSVLQIARQIIFEQTAFNGDYVEQEKENLKKQILALINDKRDYAQMRCVEIMCEGEPYGLSEHGNINDVDFLNKDALYTHYTEKLLKGSVDIFITGNIDISHAVDAVGEMTSKLTPSGANLRTVTVNDVANKKIIENEDISQAKLSMGFRTKIAPSHEQYIPLMMYNAILGGGAYSKLFNNVREKLSLAYYTYSRLDKFKGIMLVNSGIDPKNFQVAFDEIMAQDYAIKRGDFTEEEFTSAMLGTVNSIKSMEDSPKMVQDYFLGQILCGRVEGLHRLAEQIEAVTREQVIDAARGVELDTCYLLAKKEENLDGV